MQEQGSRQGDTPADEAARLATTAARQEGDAPAAPAASRPRRPSPGRVAAAAVVGALSVALIAVSAFFLFSPANGVDAGGSALHTTVEQEAEPTAAPSDEPTSDDGAAGQDAAEAQAEGSDGAPAVDDVAAAPGSGTSAGVSGGQASGPSVQGGGGADGGGSGQAQPSQPATVTVSVSVDSSAADGRVSGGANPTFEQGATVYDALMACGLSVNASSTPLGIYVSAIGGLAEKEYPGESGWKFSVNGEVVMRSCDSVVLQDGDVVRWFYAR